MSCNFPSIKYYTESFSLSIMISLSFFLSHHSDVKIDICFISHSSCTSVLPSIKLMLYICYSSYNKFLTEHILLVFVELLSMCLNALELFSLVFSEIKQKLFALEYFSFLFCEENKTCKSVF